MSVPDMKASELFSRIHRDLIEVSGYIAQIEKARRTRAQDPRDAHISRGLQLRYLHRDTQL
jgi:hypothetical protein